MRQGDPAIEEARAGEVLNRTLDRGVTLIDTARSYGLANAPWKFAGQPRGDYCREYWLRWKAMGIVANATDMDALALRFAAFAPAVSCVIVGTASTEHLLHDRQLVEQGPLGPARFRELRQLFRRHGAHWPGRI